VTRVAILDYPDYRPFDLEEATAAELGMRLSIVSIESFRQQPFAVDVRLNAGGWPLTGELLLASSCRWAVGYGIGMDWCGRDDARAHNVTVVNMPLANAPDVALHALALMLGTVRKLPFFDAQVRGGDFSSVAGMPLLRLEGRTLGLLGFGNIPRRLAQLARPLGLEILAFDPGVEPETIRDHGVTPVGSLTALLSRSHILSVHVPSTPTTQRLLDEKAIGLLPIGATLILTSRGEVYDPRAVAEALRRGHLAAAGIDVFDPEPPGLSHLLLHAPNTILTPHVAGWSVESVVSMHLTAAAVLRAIAAGDPLPPDARAYLP